MWPFLKFQRQKKNREASSELQPAAELSTEEHRRPMSLDALIDSMGSVDDLRDHDAALKFWLPEPAMDMLNEIRDLSGDSMSSFLRRFLAVHIYGLYAFHLMERNHPGLFKEPVFQDVGIRFSLRMPAEVVALDECKAEPRKRVTTYWVPELGKNIESIKLWLPKRMKEELGFLAAHSGLRLSEYVREIVIARLLGHGALPMRPSMFDVLPNDTSMAWEDDREIPMRQIVVCASDELELRGGYSRQDEAAESSA
jgi:hypothetical protein